MMWESHTYAKMVLTADEDLTQSHRHEQDRSTGGVHHNRRELCAAMPILRDEPPEVHDSYAVGFNDEGMPVREVSPLLPRCSLWRRLGTFGLLALIGDSELENFVEHDGFNCWAGNGGDPVTSGDEHDPRSLKQCKLDCKSHKECQGVIVMRGAKTGPCWLRKNIQLARCAQFTAWALWVYAEVDQAQQTTTTTPPPTTTTEKPKVIDVPLTNGQVGGPGSSPNAKIHGKLFAKEGKGDRNRHGVGDGPEKDPRAAVQGAELASLKKFVLHAGYNCWAGNGADPVPGMSNLGEKTLLDCKLACVRANGCQGVVVNAGATRGNCWFRHNIDLSRCAKGTAWNLWLQPVHAPLHEFYMYRATKPGDFDKFPVGQINTANMDGLIWYLMNEVVTNYSKGSRCPRKFGISEIHRMRVRSRATPELAAEGMSFGARFAYDFGECMGRCFPDNMCTSNDDCDFHYRKYGFVPGCNRFTDKWPFPNLDTATPGGIWYSLPLSGRCEGVPTGAKDCTWSFEDAGVISLLELESLSHGSDNCCHGHCTNFWVDQYKVGAAGWKVNQALDLFHKKYPSMPRDLEPAPCDFNRVKWYAQDTWQRRDPWG